MLVLDNEQVKPVDGTMLSVNATVPVNPFSGVIVMTEVAAVPAAVVTLVGLADMEKSTKWNVTLVELVVDPLVAVTVAVSVWAFVEEQVRVEVPLVPRTILVGLRRQVPPGEEVTVRATVPVKLPRAATVIVEVPPVAPTFAVTLVGLALRLIPGGGPSEFIVTVTVVEFVIRLFVPPFPIICTLYGPEVVPVNEQVPVPGVVIDTVTDDVQVTVSVPGPVTMSEIATEPAKPLPEGTLSRLVTVRETPAEPPGLKLTLDEFVAILNPSTWIVRVPPVLVVRPVAAIADLYKSEPVPVAVKLINFTIVWPAAKENAGGRATVIPVVPTTFALVLKVIVPV
jgi:hypothetical protein